MRTETQARIKDGARGETPKRSAPFFPTASDVPRACSVAIAVILAVFSAIKCVRIEAIFVSRGIEKRNNRTLRHVNSSNCQRDNLSKMCSKSAVFCTQLFVILLFDKIGFSPFRSFL